MHDPTAEPVQFGVIISRYRAELERLNYVRETINVCLLSIRSLFLALRTQVGHASPSVRGAINRRLRSLSCAMAARCSGDRRRSASSASPSAIDACHGSRWRAVRQAFGQRSGRHRDKAGAVGSVSGEAVRHSAVAASKRL